MERFVRIYCDRVDYQHFKNTTTNGLISKSRRTTSSVLPPTRHGTGFKLLFGYRIF